jgi:hypothetical protein
MATFQDFFFKLLVIQKLMYTDGTLTPPFRLADHLGVRDAQSHAWDNDRAFTVYEEARAHFEALEIGDDLLATVDELLIDGGLEVYQECAPVWDGEDDLFDVRSLADLDLLPHLRRVIGSEFLSAPGMQEELAARGIAAE